MPERRLAVVGAIALALVVGAADGASTSSPAETLAASPGSPLVRPGEPWIVYEGPAPEVDSVGIRVIRPDGSDEHWATPDAPITHDPGASGGGRGDGWQMQPDWSPDGQHLAFVVDTWPEGSTRDLWISDADGSNPRRAYDCVTPCLNAQWPAWSSDGRSLLFASWDHDDRGTNGDRLQLLDLATGTVTTLATTTGPEYLFYPRWSPDGRSIVAEIDTYTDISDAATLVSTGIVVVDVATTPATVTRLTGPDVDAEYPDWHPSQDLIVYQSRPSGDAGAPFALFTMHPDGSGVSLLAKDALSLTQPTWLPDGSGVLLTRVRGDDYENTSTMLIASTDGTIRPATSDRPHFGTHARMRPVSLP